MPERAFRLGICSVRDVRGVCLICNKTEKLQFKCKCKKRRGSSVTLSWRGGGEVDHFRSFKIHAQSGARHRKCLSNEEAVTSPAAGGAFKGGFGYTNLYLQAYLLIYP